MRDFSPAKSSAIDDDGNSASGSSATGSPSDTLPIDSTAFATGLLYHAATGIAGGVAGFLVSRAFQVVRGGEKPSAATSLMSGVLGGLASGVVQGVMTARSRKPTVLEMRPSSQSPIPEMRVPEMRAPEMTGPDSQDAEVPGDDDAGTYTDLARQKAAAEAANAAKSRYLANVSHEIRSPLNAIYGYAQLLERGSAVDVADAARVIRRSAEHLTDLVEGLLDMSLVENGVMRVSTDTVRLPSFIEQIERMFRPSAQAKGLVFRTEIVGHLPDYVRTDQKRLRQVLINLITNAIKYTHKGEVVLAIRYSGQVATFEVRDTGPGIPPEAQERIFAPFDRGVEGGRAGGIGLGLPITRAIVQILGGELELESTPGEGSVFRVRVMLGQVVGHRDGPGEGTGENRRCATGYLGMRRAILVADDDPRQLAFVRQVLTDLGFDVSAAPDGQTALAMARARHFDLALLDIAMPGWSGWQTASALHEAAGPDLRIVMLSANAHERHGPAEPGIETVHDRFLVKPVEIDTLVDTIGELLDLTWIFAPSDAEPETVASVETGEDEVIELTPEARVHLDRLRDKVRIGHVRGIEAEIRELESRVPEGCTLVARLYDCLDRFDLAGMARMLEKA
ncbi:histidine kinase [Novosphingobium nitrogenifigens DSM 19370]|uniref:histidine kinase n=2 Tax=Novosphingobium nitrogenifigens TaxID=378548 RepID=F1Z8K6_9SPHN|nr:ATP-binding protein [Novosphingobium nitrogenifigens]EGD59019.1 histidine kinase [Novosphingobium nitrogenifigens DSM 19370]